MLGTDSFYYGSGPLSFSDPDHPFVIRSFADPNPRLRTRSMIAIMPITANNTY